MTEGRLEAAFAFAALGVSVEVLDVRGMAKWTFHNFSVAKSAFVKLLLGAEAFIADVFSIAEAFVLGFLVSVEELVDFVVGEWGVFY